MCDPEGIGNWPRRLLHVESMSSYQWSPGAWYGQFRAPKYNAISYTWGRYRLDNPRNPPPKALKRINGVAIKGIKWDIPPINPDHFTEEEFKTCISRVANGVEGEQVDFIWLDVACIDQNPESVEGSLEVGRQAAIFQGAQEVFFWLTNHPSHDARECLTTITVALAGTSKIVQHMSFWYVLSFF